MGRNRFHPERFKDDRSDAQRQTHSVFIGGVDTFLSGWGPPAENGVKSRAYWSCRPEHAEQVRAWVESREEFKGVKSPDDPRVNGHDFIHVYVVEPGHRALDTEGAE